MHSGSLFSVAGTQGLEALAAGVEFVIQGTNFGGVLEGITIFIQHPPMGFFFQQGLVFVLGVDIQKHFSQDLQVSDSAGRTIDKTSRAAVAAQCAAQNAFTGVVG